MRLFSNMLTFNRIKDGEDGGAGPIPIPEGSWDINIEYERNKYKAPVVEYKNLMYLLNKEGAFKGINPQDDYAQNGKNATWVLVPSYQLLLVNALIAEFGKIGSFVFTKDHFISQWGYDKNGNQSNNYELFSPDGDEWFPNFAVDAYSGVIKVNRGDVGMFTIQGSDLVGINNEGTPIIKFTTDKIDDLPTTQLIEKLVFIGFQGSVLFKKDALGGGVASYMDEFQEKINIPSVDSPVKLYDLDIIPPTDIRWHNTDFEDPDYGSITTIKEGELKITDVRVLDEEGKDVPCEYIYEGEEIVGITFRSRNAGYYTIAGEILSRITVPSQGYAEDVALCEATFRELNYEIGKASNTVLASDGILSYYRSDDYFKFKSGSGFETVSGNYGLKVSPNGLYRLKNGEWELL